MINPFGRTGGRHRRTWRWRRHRDDHPGWSPAEIELVNERYQELLTADRARRVSASSPQ